MDLIREAQLSTSQRRCVDHTGATLLVRGVPGSGKTVVLLRRALKLAERREKVVLLTYTGTLARFSSELLAKLAHDEVSVQTFHSWARGVLGSRGQQCPDNDQRDALIEEALQVAGSRARQERHSLLGRNLHFWNSEIDWLKGWPISSLDDYLNAERTGRETPLVAAQRQVVWEVFQAYEALLERERLCDWIDFTRRLLDKYPDRLPERHRIPHVLVDEAQDLHAAELRLLRAAAEKTLTIAADERQQIYPRWFSWKDLGIEVRGASSKRLEQSFRSTRQIHLLAASLRAHDPRIPEEEGASAVPEAEGPLPVVFKTSRRDLECSAAVELAAELRRKCPTETIALIGRGKAKQRLAKQLSAEGVVAETLTGRDGEIVRPGIKLLTFHAAKGLEFDHVLLVGLGAADFPLDPPEHSSRAETEVFYAQERRLLYVSMTRARLALYLFYAHEASPFIHELDPALYQVRSV